MGRWAKSHDQRKGQWLINAIREDPKFPKITKKDIENQSLNQAINNNKAMIELRLWNMTNEEFEKIMGRYYD